MHTLHTHAGACTHRQTGCTHTWLTSSECSDIIDLTLITMPGIKRNNYYANTVVFIIGVSFLNFLLHI